MTEKQDETCENCGHNVNIHYTQGCRDCGCKKFKAKNHSPQVSLNQKRQIPREMGKLLPEDTPSDNSEKLVSLPEPEGTFNLSDEIQVITDYYKMPETVKFITIRHVKEFIRVCIALSRKIKGVEGDWINVNVLQEQAGEELK